MEATTAVKYKIRDNVLVHTPQRKGKASALHKPWAGPYIVIQSREGNTYRLKKADNFRKRIIRHADQIRPIHPRPPRLYSNESKILRSIQNQTENKHWTLNQFVINPMTTLEKNTQKTAAKGRQKSQEEVNE